MGITDNPDKTHCFSGSEKNPMKSLGGFPWSSPGTCGGSRYGEKTRLQIQSHHIFQVVCCEATYNYSYLV